MVNKEINPDTIFTLQRAIDGRLYTVIGHFAQEAHETPTEQLIRIVKSDMQNELFMKNSKLKRQ